MDITNRATALEWLAAWGDAMRPGIAKAAAHGARANVAICRLHHCPGAAQDYQEASDAIEAYIARRWGRMEGDHVA